MERIITLHFGGDRVWQILSDFIYPFFNAPQVFFGKPFQALQKAGLNSTEYCID